jgi:hypothetical protein
MEGGQKDMQKGDYGKNLVEKPLWEVYPGIKNRQSPAMTFMSSKQIPGINYYIALGWIYEIPEPNPHIHEQVTNFDKIVLYWGCDYKNPEDLGAEIEFYVGGQPLTFNTSAALYVPKGLSHGPITWKKCRRPHMEMMLMLGTGSMPEVLADSGMKEAKNELSEKKTRINYEQYLVKKPAYEVVAENVVKGRMHPSMTFMNNELIPGSNTYIEYSWIWEKPDPDPHIFEHTHDEYDEIVLHVGSDPNDPEDLGAEIDFTLSGQHLKLKRTSAIYVPKGVKHGPLMWKRVSQPHIEMAMVFGAGTLAQSDPGGHRKR